jgi:hypothetical protein
MVFDCMRNRITVVVAEEALKCVMKFLEDNPKTLLRQVIFTANDLQ